MLGSRIVLQDQIDGFDAMRAALKAYNPLPPSTRRAPPFCRYMAKKLNVILPTEDLKLWLALATARERHVFVDAYHGYEPQSEQEFREIEITLHELCADTGYKATFYKGVTSGLYVMQIKRHKYPSSAKRREKLRRDLASGQLTADAAAFVARPE